jgi:prepilin-type N-terminal cleavage/methylation domain-containing protein
MIIWTQATSSQRGMSLVELLVATALGTLIIAGTFTAYARGRSAYDAAQIESRLHEKAQYLFATLEPELQMAGYFGPGATLPSADAASLPLPARACGHAHATELDQAIEITDDRYNLACVAQGGGSIAGTDVLTVRRASAELAVPTRGRLQIVGSVVDPRANALLWQGVLPTSVTLAPPATELRDLVVRSYYVARFADGDRNTPALRVKSLTAIAGAPAFIDTEVMSGVENLQVQVHRTSAAQTVQVTAVLRSDAADTRANQPLRRVSYSRVFQVRNAARS